MELFPAAAGEVYLLRPGGEPAIVVRDPAPEDRALLERLAVGPVPACDRLAPLAEAGLLVREPEESLEADEAERFSRQLPYFAETGDPVATQRRLRGARVAVIGCGGLGTWALSALAGLGIGAFTLVDDDTVELANLNRQILYGLADVGTAKAACAARWVRALDPRIAVRDIPHRVESEADAAVAIEGADAVVLAADWPAYELGRWVNAACVAARVPFLLGGQVPPTLKVGPTYAPGRGPCFACHERRLAAEFPLYIELAEHRRRHPAAATTLGPASGVVGTLMALEVMHLLTGDEPVATLGRALLIDMRTLEQHWEAVERDSECPVCATA